jgi:hypothetical protein
MIKLIQVQELIQSVLKEVSLYSINAEYLLVGTAAQESQLGSYIAQYPTGPAQGIFQMEPATEKDIWKNYLTYRNDLAEKVYHVCKYDPRERDSALRTDLVYQVMMARLHYYRRPEPLPPYDDIQAIAAYWKQHYNTPLGHGTEEQFINNFPKELKL